MTTCSRCINCTMVYEAHYNTRIVNCVIFCYNVVLLATSSSFSPCLCVCVITLLLLSDTPQHLHFSTTFYLFSHPRDVTCVVFTCLPPPLHVAMAVCLRWKKQASCSSRSGDGGTHNTHTHMHTTISVAKSLACQH